MSDTAITTLLFFGAAITLVGIGIQLYSSRKIPKSCDEFYSSSTEKSVIDAVNHFEGDIREKNK